MRKVILVFIGLVGIVLAGAADSRACSCIVNTKSQKTQVREALASSGAVFSGNVISVEPNGEFEVVVTIKVARTWKGKLFGEVKLRTPKDSAMCGFYFEPGKEYLIYSSGAVTDLSTTNCSRTSALAGNSDIKYLRRRSVK